MPDMKGSGLGVWRGLSHPLAVDDVVEGIASLRLPMAGPSTAFSPALVYVGTVVIESEDDVAVFDTGFPYHIDEYLVPYLASHGKKPTDVTLVINSHDHFDHVAGNQRLKELSGAPVAASELALGTIPGGVERPLQPGEVLTVGRFDFTVIPLPGHCDTAIGLYEPVRGIVLSGDACCGNGGPDQGLAIITSIEAYRKSLEMVSDLDVQVLVPAHPFRGMEGPVLRGPDITAFLSLCRASVDAYEEHAARIVGDATEPLSRAQLHEALVEAVAWDAEEMKIFYLKFLSAISRVTADALVDQCLPPRLKDSLTDDRWLDVGSVYGTGD